MKMTLDGDGATDAENDSWWFLGRNLRVRELLMEERLGNVLLKVLGG